MGKQWLWARAQTGLQHSGRLVATLLAVSGLALVGSDEGNEALAAQKDSKRPDMNGLNVPVRVGDGYVQVPVVG